jgi:peptide/nickel transport system substrate-binding protein
VILTNGMFRYSRQEPLWRRLVKTVVMLLCAGLSVVASWACAEEPKRGGTLTIPLNGNPRMWPLVGGLPNILVNKVLYNYLLEYDAATLAPRGDLAKTWEVSADGLVWTFSLRKQVTWHDGHPFTANDVKFSFEVRMHPDILFYLRGNLSDSTICIPSSRIYACVRH